MQIPFIGGAYKGRSTDLNAQVCINLYPEIDRQEAKNIRALIGTPGLKSFCDTSVSDPVRGFHVMGDHLYTVIGNTLYKVYSDGTYDSLGSPLGTSEGYVWMADNGTEVMVVDPGINGYIYTGDIFAGITAAGFPIPSSLTYQDGYFIVTEKDTGKFFISGSYDGTSWDALDYATAESNPDDLLACLSDHGEVWLFGKDTTEVWYNSGAADFPFQRVPGVFIPEGIKAPGSPARLDNSILWLTDKLQVVRVDGYTPRIVSTPHLEYRFAQYETTEDAHGYGYTQEGHVFYVLTFPDAGATWVYDPTTDLWHQRQSYPVHQSGDAGRHRANCYAYFAGKHIVGDYVKGELYELDMDTFDDDGETIRRIRTCQVIHKDRRNLFFPRFELDFEGGVGLSTGQGDDPQAMLQWSDDGGHTWSYERWVDIGPIGEYTARAVWRRLGRSRNRVFRVMVSDPVKYVLIAANAEIEIGSA